MCLCVYIKHVIGQIISLQISLFKYSVLLKKQLKLQIFKHLQVFRDYTIWVHLETIII